MWARIFSGWCFNYDDDDDDDCDYDDDYDDYDDDYDDGNLFHLEDLLFRDRT